MWPLLWKGIVVFTALAFISSVFKHRPPKSLDSALVLLLLLLVFFEKRLYILCAQKNGAAFWVDEHSFPSCSVCVYSTHLSNTGILTFQDLRCLPFPLKLSQASFLSPGLTLLSHRYTGQHSHRLTLAGSFLWFLKMVPELPCPFLQALSSGASKKRRCEGKTPARAVLHVVVGMRSQKCPPVHFPEPRQCSLSSDSLRMPCECLSWGYTKFKCSRMDKRRKNKS